MGAPGTGNSGVSEEMVLCIFCNKPGPRAFEDIVAKWMANDLGGTGTVKTHQIDFHVGESPRARHHLSGNLAALKLRDVCAFCNNGWMSDLEDQTAPIIRPLIEPVDHTVSTAHRRQIAAWAQMKCITLDAYLGLQEGGIRHLPVHLAHDFFDDRQPLPNTLVSVATIQPFGYPGVGVPYARDMRNFAANSRHPAIEFVAVTFAFGQMLIQVLLGAFAGNDRTIEARFPSHDPRLLNLWPPDIDNDVVWPTVVLTTGSFWPISRLEGG